MYNQHYLSNHPPLKCVSCGCMFTNPMGLQCHWYNHTKKEGVFPCNRCDTVYPFSSQLESQKFLYQRISHFPCTSEGCKKVFRWEADHTAHEKIHKDIDHKCPECEYSAKDICYLRPHQYVHSAAMKYTCSAWGKGFCFYQQFQCHDSTTCVREVYSDEY